MQRQTIVTIHMRLGQLVKLLRFPKGRKGFVSLSQIDLHSSLEPTSQGPTSSTRAYDSRISRGSRKLPCSTKTQVVCKAMLQVILHYIAELFAQLDSFPHGAQPGFLFSAKLCKGAILQLSSIEVCAKSAFFEKI